MADQRRLGKRSRNDDNAKLLPIHNILDITRHAFLEFAKWICATFFVAILCQ